MHTILSAPGSDWSCLARRSTSYSRHRPDPKWPRDSRRSSSASLGKPETNPRRPEETSLPGRSTSGAESSSRTPWFIAAAAVAVVIVAIGGLLALRSGSDAPMGADPLELTAAPFDAAASCIVPSADVLAPVEVAFAGTVTAIDGETITLTVDRWYAGGDTGTVIVTAPAGLEALTGSVPWVEGGSFLVSATGGVVNYCGLSGPATPELQRLFDDAFGG